jgi:hypothetical protein
VKRVVAVAILLVVAWGAVAHAAPTVNGPTATADRPEVELGSDLRVTVQGFQSQKVTLAICGNEARRGSGDCNMTSSMAEGLAPDSMPTVITMRVAAPPTPCPCLVRVSSGLDEEVAVAPIRIIGHPVAPVADSPNLNNPFVLTIRAEPVSGGTVGWMRSSLGGPVRYQVTATVRNRSTVPLDVARVAGAAGRSDSSDLVSFTFGEPGTLQPGQTWTQVVTATLPAPSFGTMKWRVSAITTGAPVFATATTDHRPWLLIFIAMILVLDLTWLAMRFLVRRHAPPSTLSVGRYRRRRRRCR